MEVFNITKIKSNAVEIVEDLVASEVPFTITIGEKEMVTLLCTPDCLEELVIGFLFTSGLIQKAGDISKIIIDQQRWTAYVDLAHDHQMEDMVFKRLYTSGCGRGTLFYNVFDLAHKTKINSNFKIEAAKITALMAEFQKSSQIYLKTGGVHSAAISDGKSIIVFKEDIGRHNALDKAIGEIVKQKGRLEDMVMITSGRISSEVIFKVRKCRIPVVISKSAPTNQAVRLAREMGISLVGFARGTRMNIYSWEERITIGG